MHGAHSWVPAHRHAHLECIGAPCFLAIPSEGLLSERKLPEDSDGIGASEPRTLSLWAQPAPGRECVAYTQQPSGNRVRTGAGVGAEEGQHFHRKTSDEKEGWPEEATSALQRHRPEEGRRCTPMAREHLFAEFQGNEKQ